MRRCWVRIGRWVTPFMRLETGKCRLVMVWHNFMVRISLLLMISLISFACCCRIWFLCLPVPLNAQLLSLASSSLCPIQSTKDTTTPLATNRLASMQSSIQTKHLTCQG